MLSELAGASSTQPRLQLGNEPQLSCRGCRSCHLPVTRGALPRAGAELLAGEGRTPGRPWQDSTAVQGTAATPHPSPLPAHHTARNSPADTKKGEGSQTLSQKDDPRFERIEQPQRSPSVMFTAPAPTALIPATSLPTWGERTSQDYWPLVSV